MKRDPGLVMVQTFSPENPIFGYLRSEDYSRFLDSEIKIRKELEYPPISRIILVVISSGDKKKARIGALKMKNQIDAIAAENNIRIMGPAEAPIFKRGKLYRYQLLLKLTDKSEQTAIIESIRKFADKSKAVKINLDVDPMRFL